MEAILPFKIKNEQKFFDSALKVGYDEMEIHKFIYVMQQSDLDTFPKMHDERINILIYGWELCEDYKHKLNPGEWELPDELETILKLLVPWSMDIWFSKEWDKCKSYLKNGLIHCLNRARDLLMRMPDMMQINWDFLLLYNLMPWNVMYLKNLTVTKDKTLENGAQSIETEELPATSEDISYVKLEQLPLIVLRLIKLFDQSSIDMVKTLCMRVIAAWNKIYQTELETSGRRLPYVPPEDKRCLLLICHIYLMAVYEADDVKGYIIDNMVNNIRFYYQGFQNSTALYAMDNLEYTPARFIALTNIHLRVQKRDFFDFFIWNKYDTSLVNLFGAVSQAYKSYLLGNLLMELNNMNEDDFAANIPLYKRLMNSYVNEREKSELFLLNELEKLELQHYAHNIIQTIKNITDFKNKICKGNRMSNIGNYENSDDTVVPIVEIRKLEPEIESNEDIIIDVDMKEDIKDVEDVEEEEKSIKVKENELRLDPIFQNLPNNENILYYVYDVLAKKDYKGWHFAKVVLLMKIIDHELNMIETWRYHPGLTTDFMLNLEIKLSHHYVDLAKIFKDHAFIEQEFWLTAFYLNPIPDIYETIKRLGMRNNRKRTDEHTKLIMSIDNVEAKYGLLSSTIDVKEIAALANTDDPDTDYHLLFSALYSLRVPDSLVKDMITAIFLPRNKSFAWVVDWAVLRARCKMIMTSTKEKKRFVELNMAEANDRLKYLIIDYEKYKNRPQLDYGTIEEGYENLMNSGDFDKESDEEEEEEDEEEDFEDDEDLYESKNKSKVSGAATTRKKEIEKVEDDNSQEDDPFLMGKRRTRARTAATLASILFQTLPRSSRRKKNEKEGRKSNEEDNDEKSSDSKSPITASESPILSPINAGCDTKDSQILNVPTKNIKEYIRNRPAFSNSTHGFRHLIDIWSIEKNELQSIDENCVSLLESSNILQRAVKWKLLNKEINPLGCNEQEHIDEIEMVIENVDLPVKKEYDFNMVTTNIEEVKSIPAYKLKNFDTVTVMEVNEEEKDLATKVVAEQELSAEQELPAEQELRAEEEVKMDTDMQVYNMESVPEEKLNDKKQLEEISHVDDKNSESVNSDMSTAVIRDSGEISESKTDSNNETEIENRIEICQDSDKHNESTKDIEIKETEQEESNEEKEESFDGNEKMVKQENKDQIEELEDLEASKDGENLITPETPTEKEPTNNHSIEKKNSDEDKDLRNLDANDGLVEKYGDREHQNLDEKVINLKSIEIQEIKDVDNTISDNNINKELGGQGKESNEEETEKLIEIERLTEEDVHKELENSEEIEINKTSPKMNEINNDYLSKPEETLTNDLESKSNQNFKDNDNTLSNEIKDDNKKSSRIDTENKNIIDQSIKREEYNKFIDEIVSTRDKNESLNKQESIEKHNQSITMEDDLNKENVTLTVEAKSEDHQKCEKFTYSPILMLENNPANSSETVESSTDSETRNLKNMCLTKTVKVLVNKLKESDLKNLRQPRVKVQRINYERYTEQFRAKRRRISGKDDDSSNNSLGTNTSSSDTYRPPKQKRKIPIRRHSMRQLQISESDDSNNSEDFKLSTVTSSRTTRDKYINIHPSISQSSTKVCLSHHTSGPKSTRNKTGPKSSKTTNLVVTPRSASGLKLRISNAEQATSLRKRPKTIVYDEIIQLSSSSSDACIINELPSIEEEIIEVEDHPLFEEEIII